MVVIGLVVGALWVVVLAFVLAMCRVAARADAQGARLDGARLEAAAAPESEPGPAPPAPRVGASPSRARVSTKALLG